MSYRIASFNIRKFSKYSVDYGDGETRKDLDTIAKIIRENSFDIIAVQEIIHKEALKALLEKISSQYAEVVDVPNIGTRVNATYGYRTKHWEGRWAQPISEYGSTNIVEGYAFIWNRDRIQLVTNAYGKSFEPRIADFGDAKGLARPPFIGRFMPINSRYEFRLINIHIVYSLPSKRIDDEEDSKNEFSQTDISDYELRRREFESIVRTIYVDFSEQVFDKTGHDKDARLLVPYTFVLGDYNLNLNSAKGNSSKAVFAKGDECIEIASKGLLKVVTVNDKLTTLRGRPNDPEKLKLLQADPIVEHHLANNYDHFSYDANKFRISPDVGTIYAFEQYAGVETQNDTKYDLYSKKISDHLPIYLEVDIRNNGI